MLWSFEACETTCLGFSKSLLFVAFTWWLVLILFSFNCVRMFRFVPVSRPRLEKKRALITMSKTLNQWLKTIRQSFSFQRFFIGLMIQVCRARVLLVRAARWLGKLSEQNYVDLDNKWDILQSSYISHRGSFLLRTISIIQSNHRSIWCLQYWGKVLLGSILHFFLTLCPRLLSSIVPIDKELLNDGYWNYTQYSQERSPKSLNDLFR